jgi:hypothetical protein
MFHRTNKKCWKCGQDVSHERYRLGKPEPGPGWRVYQDTEAAFNHGAGESGARTFTCNRPC